ncbi:MAG: Crp/Fnr family transcriptional regulator [Ferruginibacter sp.]
MSILSFIEEPIKAKYFTKGEVIYNEGSIAQYFYEVKTGEVKIVNSNDDGKDFIQAVYKANESFGLPLLFSGKTYPAAAFAHTHCEVFIVPKKQFLTLLENNYDFHFSVTKMISEQLLYKTIMLQEVANEEGEHCLLTLIHYLIEQTKGANDTLHITKQQLANMTGLRVETVIRIMKNIEDKGWIKTSRGNIVCNLTNKTH